MLTSKSYQKNSDGVKELYLKICLLRPSFPNGLAFEFI